MGEGVLRGDQAAQPLPASSAVPVTQHSPFQPMTLFRGPRGPRLGCRKARTWDLPLRPTFPMTNPTEYTDLQQLLQLPPSTQKLSSACSWSSMMLCLMTWEGQAGRGAGPTMQDSRGPLRGRDQREQPGPAHVGVQVLGRGCYRDPMRGWVCPKPLLLLLLTLQY